MSQFHVRGGLELTRADTSMMTIPASGAVFGIKVVDSDMSTNWDL